MEPLNSATDKDIKSLIEAAKVIETATQQWAQSQDAAMRWFVFLLALFPGVAAEVIEAIYKQVAEKNGFAVESVSGLIAKSSGYVSDRNRPRLSHPSYRNALITMMREQYEHIIAEVVDLGLQAIIRSDTFQITQCDAADFGWTRYGPGVTVFAENYLEQFIEAYNLIRNRIFSETKTCLAPYEARDGTALFLLHPGGSGGMFCIAPAQYKSVMTEQPINVRERMDDLHMQAWRAHTHSTFYHISTEDFVKRSPQTHALNTIKTELKYAFEKHRINESWQITHLRMEKSLRHSMWKMLGIEIDFTEPWSDDKYISLVQQFAKKEPYFTPPYEVQPGFLEHMRSDFAYQIVTVSKCHSILKERGITFKGNLIPPPDNLRNERIRTVYGRYSPEQAEKLIRCSLSHLIESYRWMLEHNFKSLIPRMSRHVQEGFKVVAVYQYYDDAWGPRGDLYLVPADFPTVENQEFEIYVFASSESTPPEIPTEVKERLRQVEESGSFPHISGIIRHLIDPKDFIKTIYDWIWGDVEYAMRWDKIGRERSRYWSEVSHQFSQQNPGVNLATDMTFRTDYFDWPKL